MQNNKVSVKELNEFLKNGKLSEFGTFSEVDIVFVAGLFLLYMQNRDNWTKIPQLFNIEESPDEWNHSHYFRQIDDLYGIKHNQIFDRFPYAYNKDANPVSRFFAPPIYINNKSIDYFFGTEKINRRINELKVKYIEFFDISDFANKKYNKYKKFAREFEEYAKEIQKRLDAIAPVFVFIFIVACKRLAQKKDRTFEKTKDYVEKIWQFTQIYTNGLHELARNIVEHSGQEENNGQGMITIRAYSGTSTDNEKIKVLETHIFDYGKKGIYGTLKQNTEKNKTDSEDDIYSLDFSILDDKENKYTIKDFIEPTDNKKFLLQQFFREMAHYGLMTFKDLIEQYSGKIITSSVREDEDNKRESYIFPENDDIKKEKEKYDIKKGTSYYFEIPFIPALFERQPEDIKEIGNQFEVSALSELQNFELLEYENINNMQPDSRKKYIMNLKVFASLKEIGRDKIDNRETENGVCKNIIDKINSPDVTKFRDVCFSLDFDDVSINKSNLLRILTRLSREKLSHFIVHNINHMIFTGLIKDNEQWFEKLKDKKNYIQDIRIETSYWLKDKSILFFTKREKIQEKKEEQKETLPKDYFYFADFLFGETPKIFNSINTIVSNTFPNTTYINKNKKFEIDSDFFIPQEIQKHFFYGSSKYLLPFDTLLKSKGKELFLFNINTILQNNLFGSHSYKDVDEYVDNVEGYRINDTHFRIGNKVHSKDFYYAKQFFQNSFYTTRLAMYLAKKIDKKLNNPKTKIMLAGYEMYSELILSLIEKFLIDIYKYKNVNHSVAQSKGEKMTFLPKVTFNNYLDDCKHYKTIIVVPIAATGSTTQKIETEIKRRYEKRTSKKIGGDLFLPYNILMAQDPVAKDTDGKFKNIKNKDKQEYPPIIDLPATWYNLKDCELCYGEKTNPLFDTDNSSLTPSLIFGNPIGKTKAKRGNEIENNLVEFNDLNFEHSMNYQSIERNDNYRIYDIDSDKFIGDNIVKIIDWLKNIVKPYLEDNYKLKSTDRVIIVSPCHESNSQFLNLINQNVFSSAATIIHHQNGVDFIENFSFLNEKHLKDENTKIFYADDSLITGKHFFELFDLIRKVTEDTKIAEPLTASIFLNDQAVPFIHNRAVELSKNYFAFVSFNQPPTLNILNERPLEHEHKRYKSLQESVLHDLLCEHFYLKAKKLNPEKRQRKENEPEKEIRRLKMFKITHEIYDYFAKNQNISSLENNEEWQKFVEFILRFEKNNVEINREDTNIKAFYKVLSQYPFVLYNELRRVTFKWHKELLGKIISIPENDCFDINKDYEEYDEKYGYDNNFSTFKFHLRRAAFLGDYQVLKVDFLKKLLMWFCKIDKYFEQNMHGKSNNREEYLRSLPLFAPNNDEQKLLKKIQNLRDFPVFVLGNYIEMIQKNGWVAYQILENIKKIDFSKSYLGRQFLIMLQIEAASVIDDFVKMVDKEHRIDWRDMYKGQTKLVTETKIIVDFFDKRPELLETNKYSLVKEIFLDNSDDWKKENTPFVNYLWIKQLLYADSIDEDPHIQFSYREEINEIINKMQGFFPDREKVQAFFIVTDGKQDPHVLWPQDNSILNNFKDEFITYKPVQYLKDEIEKTEEKMRKNSNNNLLKQELEKKKEDLENKKKKAELEIGGLTTKTLIDFLNGESDNAKNAKKTTVEFISNNGKWTNIYENNDNRNLEFMPAKYQWLYLIRISKQKKDIEDNCKFEAQGVLGFYSTEDLKENILPKQLLMLLRKDIGVFINKHHKNDEFARLIQQEEKNKYVVKLNHGVQTYENTIEYQFKEKFKDDLEENVKTLLRYLANKLHLISKLNSDNCEKTEEITLNEIKNEFVDKYKFVFSLPMPIRNRIEKTNIDNIVHFNINFKNLDSKYFFPVKSYKDIIFEILLNIRRYGIGDNTFTSSDRMIINITVENINGNQFLAISNTYKGDLGRFENLNNDDEPHGIDLLRQLWHSHNLGRIDIIPPSRESQIFKLLIQLKGVKNENQS